LENKKKKQYVEQQPSTSSKTMYKAFTPHEKFVWTAAERTYVESLPASSAKTKRLATVQKKLDALQRKAVTDHSPSADDAFLKAAVQGHADALESHASGGCRKVLVLSAEIAHCGPENQHFADASYQKTEQPAAKIP
jgi:hypothetical protein